MSNKPFSPVHTSRPGLIPSLLAAALCWSVPAQSATYTYQHDDLNRLTTITDPVGSTEHLSYDTGGNLGAVTTQIATPSPAPLTVTVPNGGEQWGQGTTQTITWSGKGVTAVKIELTKGGVLNQTITTSAPNTGRFPWRIPPTQAIASDYRIRITAAQNSGNWDESNANFSIAKSVLPVRTQSGAGPRE